MTPAGVERAPVRGGVDPERHAADDDDARPRRRRAASSDAIAASVRESPAWRPPTQHGRAAARARRPARAVSQLRAASSGASAEVGAGPAGSPAAPRRMAQAGAHAPSGRHAVAAPGPRRRAHRRRGSTPSRSATVRGDALSTRSWPRPLRPRSSLARSDACDAPASSRHGASSATVSSALHRPRRAAGLPRSRAAATRRRTGSEPLPGHRRHRRRRGCSTATEMSMRSASGPLSRAR